ncbi:MAG: substrate-binding domain-containing protein [Bacteroidales bacterium]
MTLDSYKFLALSVVATLIILVSSCTNPKPSSTHTSGLMTIVCDETFENILSQEIDVFEFTYRDASVIPVYVSQKAAIDSLLEFKTRMIITSNELSKEQKDYILSKKRGGLRSQRVAVDAIALIVNPKNPIDELSMSELEEIMTGKVTKWNELSPSKMGDIKIVFDNQGSSTVQYMRDSIMNGQPFPENVFAQNSNREVFEAVQKLRGAVGIIGVSWISTDLKTKTQSLEERVAGLSVNDTTTIEFNQDIKVLKLRRDDMINSYGPYQAYIYDGSYPLYRSIYATSSAPVGTITHGFYAFITGYIGQKIIQRTGVLPAVVQPRMVNLN